MCILRLLPFVHSQPEHIADVCNKSTCRWEPLISSFHIIVQVRIMFEVQDLRFATLATVSRCGMVWFSEDVLSLDMIFEHYLTRLRNISIDEGEEEVRGRLQIGKGTA